MTRPPPPGHPTPAWRDFGGATGGKGRWLRDRVHSGATLWAPGSPRREWNCFVDNSLSNTAYLKTVRATNRAIIPLNAYYFSIYGLSQWEGRPETTYRYR